MDLTPTLDRGVTLALARSILRLPMAEGEVVVAPRAALAAIGTHQEQAQHGGFERSLALRTAHFCAAAEGTDAEQTKGKEPHLVSGALLTVFALSPRPRVAAILVERFEDEKSGSPLPLPAGLTALRRLVIN